jgi:hypothetical protein
MFERLSQRFQMYVITVTRIFKITITTGKNNSKHIQPNPHVRMFKLALFNVCLTVTETVGNAI